MSRDLALLHLEFIEARLSKVLKQLRLAVVQGRSIDAALAVCDARDLRSQIEELEDCWL